MQERLLREHALESLAAENTGQPGLKVNWDDLLRDLEPATAELKEIFLQVNWTLLQNSLLVSGLTTVLSVGLGLVAALWLAGLETRWRSAVADGGGVALRLPPFLVTNCWLHYRGTAERGGAGCR